MLILTHISTLLSTPNLIFWLGFWPLAGVAAGLFFALRRFRGHKQNSGIVDGIIAFMLALLITALPMIIVNLWQSHRDAERTDDETCNLITLADSFMEEGFFDKSFSVLDKIPSTNDHELQDRILGRKIICCHCKVNGPADVHYFREANVYKRLLEQRRDGVGQLEVYSNIFQLHKYTQNSRLKAQIYYEKVEVFSGLYKENYDLSRLDSTVHYCKLAIYSLEVEPYPFFLASVGVELAWAAKEHYLQSKDKEILDSAIYTLSRVTKKIEPEQNSSEYGLLQLDLGIMYLCRSRDADAQLNLNLAKDAFGEAQSYIDCVEYPMECIILELHIGIASSMEH